MSPASRTSRRLLAGLLLLGLVAAGCGSDDESAPEADEASASTEDAGAFPVTLEHKFGTIEIPAMPERVVSLGYTEQDAILAFGVVPVAVRYAFGPEDDVFFPWADEAAGDAKPEILPRADVNFEQVAALEPDLIMAVTAGLDEEQYEKLSAIAPTVVPPEGFVDFGVPWQEQTLITGKAFGQEERAQELVDEVEGLMADAKAAHPELEGVTLTLSGPAYDGEYPFHASDDTRTRFFGDLGFVVPEELDAIAGDQFYGTVSREQASLLDNDVVVWQSGAPEERAGIEADPILANLAATKEGRAVFIEGSDYDAIQFSSALSLPFLIESFVPKLAAAVK